MNTKSNKDNKTKSKQDQKVIKKSEDIPKPD